MEDLTKDAIEVLETATAKVKDAKAYEGNEQMTGVVTLHVRLASAHAQMAVARQAEIANLLQARRDFADTEHVVRELNERLFTLLRI